MAIDRKIITWETVFESKRYDQILNMLIENYKAIYGGDINLAVNTAEGETIRMLATYLYDFSVMAAEVYQSLDINNAKNKLLDNLALLSGNLVRKTSRPTRITGTLSWTGDDIDNYGLQTSVIVLDENFNRWAISPINTELTTLDNAGVEVNIVATENGDIYLSNSYIELSVGGEFISNSIIITNIIYIEQGSIQESDRQLRARRREALSYSSKTLVDSIKEEVLANIFSIKDIKIYNSNISGGLTLPLWNGTKNANNIVAGDLVTILSLGDTNWNTLFDTTGITYTVGSIGQATINGVGTGVVTAAVIIPEHDIFVLIKPQTIEVGEGIVSDSKTSLALSTVLQRKITLGISTFQDEDEVLDENYISQVLNTNDLYPSITEIYKYYVAQPFRAHIIIDILSIPSSGYNAPNTLSRVRKALYDLSLDYPINKQISIAEIINEVNLKGNLDPNNPTFLIRGVDITEGTDVKNGYWYVNGINDDFITFS